jgi:hypothetical protein
MQVSFDSALALKLEKKRVYFILVQRKESFRGDPRGYVYASGQGANRRFTRRKAAIGRTLLRGLISQNGYYFPLCRFLNN